MLLEMIFSPFTSGHPDLPSMPTLTTPVALMFYKRPDTTIKVMEQIKVARPEVLVLISDGPRPDRLDESDLVQHTRDVVESMIDWDCTVLKNYSEQNEGLFKGQPRKLTWLFEQVEQAIVLEDDCVPHLSFFDFCETLLKHYRDDERVMHISGNNFQRGRQRGNASYYFTRYTHVWGWASWRRAWQYFDSNMSQLQEAIDSQWLRAVLPEFSHYFFWKTMLTRNRNLSHKGRGPIWDAAWLLTCWLQNGLSINPAVNLVTNIGAGTSGSHQFSPDNRLLNVPAEPLTFPLCHPKYIARDCAADDFTQRDVYLRGLLDRVTDRIHRHI